MGALAFSLSLASCLVPTPDYCDPADLSRAPADGAADLRLCPPGQLCSQRHQCLPPRISVTVVVSGAGRVTSTPGGLDCAGLCSAAWGDDVVQVSLSATPVPGASVFAGFSGPGCAPDPLAGRCTLDPGTYQITARFQDCGKADGRCCPGTSPCGANLTCASGTCRCGGVGQACCAGSRCDGGLLCQGGSCQPCGGLDQACCAVSACGPYLDCQAGQCRSQLGECQVFCVNDCARLHSVPDLTQSDCRGRGTICTGAGMTTCRIRWPGISGILLYERMGGCCP